MNNTERQLVEDGKAIEAIQAFRERVDIPLMLAKAEVDRIRRNMKARAQRTARQPETDPDLIRKMNRKLNKRFNQLLREGKVK